MEGRVTHQIEVLFMGEWRPFGPSFLTLEVAEMRLIFLFNLQAYSGYKYQIMSSK